MCLSMLLEKVSTKTNFPNTLQVKLVLELYYVRRVVCVFGADIVLANIVSPHIHPGQPTPLLVDAATVVCYQAQYFPPVLDHESFQFAVVRSTLCRKLHA